MKGKKEVIDVLNEALKLELGAEKAQPLIAKFASVWSKMF